MKKAITTFFLFFYGYCLCAQYLNIENEIRSLEQTEVQAVLNKDTVTLKKLWDKDYIVNNPENKIVLGKPNPVDRPVLQNQRVSFTRDVEKISLMVILQFQWEMKLLYQPEMLQMQDKQLNGGTPISG